MSTLASRDGAQNLNFGISALEMRTKLEESQSTTMRSLDQAVAKLPTKQPSQKDADIPPLPDAQLSEAINRYLDECEEAFSKLVRDLRVEIDKLSTTKKEMEKGQTFIPPSPNTDADILRVTGPRSAVWFFQNSEIKTSQIQRIEKQMRSLAKIRSQIKNVNDPDSLLQLAIHFGPKLDARYNHSIGFLSDATVILAFGAHEAAVLYDESTYIVWLESTAGLSTGAQILPCAVFVDGTATLDVPGKTSTSVTLLRAVSEADIASVLKSRKPSSEPPATNTSKQSAEAGDSPMRTWTDKTGKFKVEAKVESFDGSRVKLKRKDGTTLEVPLTTLSEADQKYLQAPERQPNQTR